MKKDFHVFFLFSLFLLFAVNAAWAANVTLQTADDGTKYVYMPDKGEDKLTILASDIDNGPKTFKVYATLGEWEDYKSSRILEISVPEGYFIGSSARLEGGKNVICKCSFGIAGYTASTTGGIPASENTLRLILDNPRKYKDANVFKFDMTVYIQAPRSISLNSVGVAGAATFFNETAVKRNSWEQNRTLEGDLITVTAVPENGYLLKGLEFKKGNDILNDVSVGDVDWYSDPTKNIVQFTMPDADISVKPIFTKIVTADNGFFINMKHYSEDITIPNGVESFKVYDEGGKDGAYLSGSRTLHLNNPSGKLFMVTGTIQTDGDKANTYLRIYDGEGWYKSSTKVEKYSEIAGKSTDIGMFVSSDNRLNIDFRGGDNPQSYDGVDLTVNLLSGSTSLSESGALDYKEVSRTDPLTIYTKFNKNDNDFRYRLQYRYSNPSDPNFTDNYWQEYGNDNHLLEYGTISIEDAANGYEHSFTITSENLKAPYEYMEFRYKVTSIDESGKEIETTHTSSVKVRLMNKVKVQTHIGNLNVDKYSVTMDNGKITLDTNNLIPYGTEIQVQANVPAGYEFRCWNPANDNFCKAHTENPITLTVVSDTTLKAGYESLSNDITLVTFVVQNGEGNTYTEETSPMDVNVDDVRNFAVKTRIAASAKLCGEECAAYTVIRKVGTNVWDTVGNVLYVNSNTQFAGVSKFGNMMNYYLDSKDNKMDGASRFEIKSVVTDQNGKVFESYSVFANLFRTLKFDRCAIQTIGGSTEGCKVIVEDELGNELGDLTSKNIIVQHGAKVKLHPVYPYNYVFHSWKNAQNGGLYDETVYLSKDSVYELTVEPNTSTMRIALGVKNRGKVNVYNVYPENNVMPYAGMTEFNLVFNREGDDPVKASFARDTTFFIKKNGLTDLFAVNKLDSMFTPGEYTLTAKIAYEDNYVSERDSAWACETNPGLKWGKETMNFIADRDKIKCTETNPAAVFYYHYSFTVRDTSFNVTFNTWDEQNNEYVQVGEAQKVNFGEVPTTPDIDCPESNTEWKFSCNWTTDFAPAVKDTAYTYQVVRSNSVLSIASVDGSKTATLAGSYDGGDAFKITEAVDVDNVELQRTFNQGASGFSTIVLPFDFNAAALTGVKSVVKFNRMTKKDNGDPVVGMAYVWCDADVEKSLQKAAENTAEPNKYDHCNSDWETFPGDMDAYTPYMVQMKGAQIGFNYVGGVTLEKTPDENDILVSNDADNGTWEFHGTTKKKVWDAEETKDGYVWGFAAQIKGPANYIGKFVQLGEGASAQPLRAYMVFKPKKSDPPAQLVAPRNASFAARPAKALGAEMASLPDEIDVVIESQGSDGEEHRTVIGTFTRSTGEFKMLRDYDLKGRKVNGVNRARGAYYGKKVLKK